MTNTILNNVNTPKKHVQILILIGHLSIKEQKEQLFPAGY